MSGDGLLACLDRQDWADSIFLDKNHSNEPDDEKMQNEPEHDPKPNATKQSQRDQLPVRQIKNRSTGRKLSEDARDVDPKNSMTKRTRRANHPIGSIAKRTRRAGFPLANLFQITVCGDPSEWFRGIVCQVNMACQGSSDSEPGRAAVGSRTNAARSFRPLQNEPACQIGSPGRRKQNEPTCQIGSLGWIRARIAGLALRFPIDENGDRLKSA